ncbi:MAG: M16 family metallopeptidase [Alphaproteobacteria bacterium]
MRAALFAAVFLVAAAAVARAAVFNPTTFTLPNGLQVVVIENHRLPVVTQMVWYKVGAADDPPGKSGIAHFLEHLMFRGTGEIMPGEFSRIVARNGGRDNAFTSWDYTAYHQTVAADRLELVMKLESDRMANLSITEAVVAPERDVIIEERRSRIDNSPAALLNEQINASLFLNHPYRIPIIGWQHEMATLTQADALDFYRRHYAPNNAVLIVSGDVTVDRVRELAAKYYGPIPRKEIAPRVRLREPLHVAPRRLVLESERVREPRLTREYLAPSYNDGDTQHAYALQVLETILSGGATSRLRKKLVEDDKIAVSIWVSYQPSALDYGSFSIGGQPRADVPLSKLEEAIDLEIARLLKDGVTADEVARAKNQLVSGAEYARDSLRSGAMAIGTALATGKTVADVEAWPERIDAVTLDQVNAAARNVFNIVNSVTGALLPAPRPRG